MNDMQFGIDDDLNPDWDDPYAPVNWYEGAGDDAWGYPQTTDDHFDTRAEYQGRK